MRIAAIGLGCALATFLSPFSLVHAQDACHRWKESIHLYEQALEAAARDEPEDIVKQLRRYGREKARGASEKAKKIDRKIRDGLIGIRAVIPPPGMERFHAAAIECYQHAVEALDADARGDSVAERAAVIRSWEALKAFFIAGRDLLAEHGCDPSEIQAINERGLPQIDATIEALRSGAALW